MYGKGASIYTLKSQSRNERIMTKPSEHSGKCVDHGRCQPRPPRLLNILALSKNNSTMDANSDGLP